jgi:hypothetical protein
MASAEQQRSTSPGRATTGSTVAREFSRTMAAIPQKSFLQEEGVLRDVLDELDRERSNRAELEAQNRVLEQELHSQKRKTASNVNTSIKDYSSLKVERDGYLEVLDALTQDRPAFSKNQTLPLHVVRLLEIIPWDPRARQHLFGQETVYEWQNLGANKSWQKELRYLPTFFKTLPIVIPQPGRTVGEAPTSSSPPKQCVLTNLGVTQILNIDKGYPLPQDGGDWKWVGGWRIEKNADTDDKGWSYSNDSEITSDSSYYSELRVPKKGTKNIVRRRRKWTRSRALIDYPHASAMTKQYLKLVAEKAGLDVSVEKLSGQLVETKMNLTTLEAEHLSLRDSTTRKISKLVKELDKKNRILGIVDDDGVNPNKKDQVNELRSVVTQWVSNTVSNRQVNTDSAHGGDTLSLTEGSDEDDAATAIAMSNRTSKQQMFGSLKGKGSGLLEKIKQKGGEELERIKQNKNGMSWQPKKNYQTASTPSETTATMVNLDP